MYGHPDLMRAWAALMKPKGRPGRPPVFGSKAWARRRQTELPFDLTPFSPLGQNPTGAKGFRSGSLVTPGQSATDCTTC
jgi:hypothetical protein